MLNIAEALEYAAEVVKIIGGLASFYAVFKLRQIERKYLFKATIPELITKLEDALSMLNRSLSKPGEHKADVMEALNYLIVDVKNIKRKCRGDAHRACKEMLGMFAMTRSRRSIFSWSETPMKFEKAVLLDIYGKGRGLIRSLENEMEDQGWSGR